MATVQFEGWAKSLRPTTGFLQFGENRSATQSAARVTGKLRSRRLHLLNMKEFALRRTRRRSWTAMQPNCPSDSELTAFHRGEADDAVLDRIADHLEGCDACTA